MGNKYTQKLLEGRRKAPDELRSPLFDAWLLGLILESLEPAQRDILEWLLCGEPIDALCTSDLCVAAHKTPTQMGAALTRLRRLGLVKTHYEVGEEDKIRRAYHVAVPWVIAADRVRLQWEREAFMEVLRAG
jgi:DNA-binding transcriptional ArsR family regulator